LQLFCLVLFCISPPEEASELPALLPLCGFLVLLLPPVAAIMEDILYMVSFNNKSNQQQIKGHIIETTRGYQVRTTVTVTTTTTTTTTTPNNSTKRASGRSCLIYLFY
jgi:hypothetical protein